MNQTISISLTQGELTQLIDSAVTGAINRRLSPTEQDELLTQQEAATYLKSSKVFIWKLAKAGKIKVLNANKKVLYPKSSIDSYLQIKKGGNR